MILLINKEDAYEKRSEIRQIRDSKINMLAEDMDIKKYHEIH